MSHTANARQRESGAALLVALILVLISSVMGVSAMQVSNVENKLADNEQYRQVAFRVAEAAGEQMLTMNNLVALANNPASTVESTDTVDSRVKVNAEMQAFGDDQAVGYSLGGPNGFVSMTFVARATAEIEAVDSISEVVQGVQRLAPFVAR